MKILSSRATKSLLVLVLLAVFFDMAIGQTNDGGLSQATRPDFIPDESWVDNAFGGTDDGKKLLERFQKMAANGGLFLAAGKALSAKVMGFAWEIFAALSFFTLGFSASRGASSNDISGFMSEFFDNFLIVGIIFWMLTDYALVCNTFSRFFYAFSSAIAGGDTRVDNGIATALGTYIDSILRTLRNLKSFGDLSSIGGGIMSIVQIIAFAIMLIICLVITLLAAFFITLSLWIGEALAGIGFALGPVFISLATWDMTRNMFWTWTKFMMASLMYKVIGMTIVMMLPLLLTSGFIPEIDGAKTTIDLPTILNVLVASVIMLYFSLKIPTISNALMPGMTGSIGSFRVPKAPGGSGVESKKGTEAGAPAAYGGGITGQAMAGGANPLRMGAALATGGTALASATIGKSMGNGVKSAAQSEIRSPGPMTTPNTRGETVSIPNRGLAGGDKGTNDPGQGSRRSLPAPGGSDPGGPNFTMPNSGARTQYGGSSGSGGTGRDISSNAANGATQSAQGNASTSAAFMGRPDGRGAPVGGTTPGADAKKMGENFVADGNGGGTTFKTWEQGGYKVASDGGRHYARDAGGGIYRFDNDTGWSPTGTSKQAAKAKKALGI